MRAARLLGFVAVTARRRAPRGSPPSYPRGARRCGPARTRSGAATARLAALSGEVDQLGTRPRARMSATSADAHTTEWPRPRRPRTRRRRRTAQRRRPACRRRPRRGPAAPRPAPPPRPTWRGPRPVGLERGQCRGVLGPQQARGTRRHGDGRRQRRQHPLPGGHRGIDRPQCRQPVDGRLDETGDAVEGAVGKQGGIAAQRQVAARQLRGDQAGRVEPVDPAPTDAGAGDVLVDQRAGSLGREPAAQARDLGRVDGEHVDDPAPGAASARAG